MMRARPLTASPLSFLKPFPPEIAINDFPLDAAAHWNPTPDDRHTGWMHER